MKNCINIEPAVAIAQFEVLRKNAQIKLDDTPEFKSALAIYEELCSLQQTLMMKEMALLKDAYKLPVS